MSVRLRARGSMRAFDVGIEVMRDGRRVDTAIGEAAVQCAATEGPDALPLSPGPGASPLAGRRPAARDGIAGGPATLFGLAPGQRAKTMRRFEPGDLDEYAELCADANPLVVDPSAARRAGLPARIVPGPLLAGMFSDLLGTRLPGRGTGWMKQSLRFLWPAHPGQALQAMVEIVRVRPDKQLVNLRSTVRDISGALLVDGESLVLVRNLARARG
ncbi:MAG: MaoC family dehydratase [Burkholderiales bacterium]|nr:MAG: MaoC family dehydratase [Burkholderiales bacterium]